MKLKFAKMHGLGNDFMVVETITQEFQPKAEQIKQWADRHLGIGFDQLLLIEKASSDRTDFKYRIFNCDGGEVAQCGNGARCFARYVSEQGLVDTSANGANANMITVETNAGILKLKSVDATRVQVNLGVPQFEPKHIPLAMDQQQLEYEVDILGKSYKFSALEIGNPHIVLQVDDVETAPVETLGALFESHELFPQRVNVGFMQVIDRSHFKLRVFERGVGETRACGSGACAAMINGVRLGLLDKHATGEVLGGKLELQWQGEGKPVMMTGDTAMVFQGEIEYD